MFNHFINYQYIDTIGQQIVKTENLINTKYRHIPYISTLHFL